MANNVLPTVESQAEELLESICERCQHPHKNPTLEEMLTGHCSECENCPIEGKVKKLVALVQASEAVEFAQMVDRAYKEAKGEVEGSLTQ